MKIKHSFRGARGFTLVELLVVMGIFGILAALMMPVLGRSNARAQSAACVSQLRQLGIATRLYADDNSYLLPTAEALPSHPTLARRPVLRICDILNHYVGRASGSSMPSRLFKCPADSDYFYETEGSSYRWNTALNGQHIDSGESLHFFGGTLVDGGSWVPTATLNHTAVETPVLLDYAQFHPQSHRSGKNVVYMDGHVAPYSVTH